MQELQLVCCRGDHGLSFDVHGAGDRTGPDYTLINITYTIMDGSKRDRRQLLKQIKRSSPVGGKKVLKRRGRGRFGIVVSFLRIPICVPSFS